MIKLNTNCPVCNEDNWDIARYNPIIKYAGEYDKVCRNCRLYHNSKGYDRTTWQGNEMFDENEFDSKRYKKLYEEKKMKIILTEYEIKEAISNYLETRGFKINYIPNDIKLDWNSGQNIYKAEVETTKKEKI